jgi:hypothetical protein
MVIKAKNWHIDLTEVPKLEIKDAEFVVIDGVKYKRVEENGQVENPTPQTLFQKLVLPYHKVGYLLDEGQRNWICGIVSEWLSENIKKSELSEDLPLSHYVENLLKSIK